MVVVMMTKRRCPYDLTDDQIDMLIEMTREGSGDHLTRSALHDRMLTLLEDIAGFETLPAGRRRKLLHLLWFRYQLVCRRKLPR